MNLIVEIPDDIAGSLSSGGDLSRRVLEGFALEEYKSQRISKAQLRRLLGLETGYELDGFLKDHQVSPNITIEDVRRDVTGFEEPGILTGAIGHRRHRPDQLSDSNRAY